MTKFPYKPVDLTHTLNENIPTWNGSCGFQAELRRNYEPIPNCQVGFRVQKLSMHGGIGTHMDAPAHCIKGGASIHEIPLENLFVKGHCIDVSAHKAPDLLVGAEVLEKYEQERGQILPGSFVIFYTGWSDFWANPKKYHNDYCFPSIAAETAQELVAKDVVGLGIDTLSPDTPKSGFPVHNQLLSRGKFIIENVANASLVAGADFYAVILPIKGQDLAESPVRLVGLLS